MNVVHLAGFLPIQAFPLPVGGRHLRATPLWTSMGLIDTAIALLALYFVAAFFGRRRHALWAGLVSLRTCVCNTFTFNYSAVVTRA